MDMLIVDIKKNAEEKMKKSIQTLRINLAKIRTNRVHTEILDHIKINYHGSFISISKVANLTLINAHTISVQPWEKQILILIEKAIRESNLSLNYAIQGDTIHISMPPLTEERRKDMAKLVKNEAEDTKIIIRNIRRDANEIFKKLVKDKICSADNERRGQDNIQKITNKFITEIDKIIIEKEKEILTI